MRGSYFPFTPFTIECMRNQLLFVSKAAAYFGFIWKALQSVLRMSSRVLSVSIGSLSAFIVRISTPSFATKMHKIALFTFLLVRFISSSSVTFFCLIVILLYCRSLFYFNSIEIQNLLASNFNQESLNPSKNSKNLFLISSNDQASVIYINTDPDFLEFKK